MVDARVLRRDSLPGSPQPIVRFTVITLIQEEGNTRKHPVRHERSLREKGILHIGAGRPGSLRVVVDLDQFLDRRVKRSSRRNEFHIDVIVEEENFHFGITWSWP